MTNKVNPSHMHPSWSDETAAMVEEGGGITGYVSDSVMLSDDDPDLDTTGINAFNATYTGNILTVDGGEAFVHGTWLAIDVATDVTIDTDGMEIGVGWTKQEVSVGRNTIAEDSAIVQPVSMFGSNDEYIPLWRVSYDATNAVITGIEDLRLLQRPIYNDLQGNIYMPYGDLDMQGHNVINTGNLIEGDQDLFVNRSGDDMYGPLEIVGDTAGGMETPLVLRNNNTDSGTSTQIQLINSTSTSSTRGSVIRSERTADGGADMFFGVGDGTAIYEPVSVNTEGIYADEFQTGNVTIGDDDTFRYNAANYMSFGANGVTTHEDLHVNTIVPDIETIIDSTRDVYRFRVMGESAMRFLDTHVTSDKPHYFLDRVEMRNSSTSAHPHMMWKNYTDGRHVNMTVTFDSTLGDGRFHLSDGVDPTNSVIRFDAVSGEGWFDGDLTVNSELQMGSNTIRMQTLGGEGGLGIDRNVYYSAFEGWATIYNNSSRGGQGWRMRDIDGAGTVFQMNPSGEALFSNKLRVGNELVLPTRTTRPASPDVGTIIYRTDKDV